MYSRSDQLALGQSERRSARIAPAAIRYIKLGSGGRWESSSLDGGRIDWGDATDPHHLAQKHDWEGARRVYVGAGHRPSVATRYLQQLRDFYLLGPDTLWITFARGMLWWAFAEGEVILQEDPAAAQSTSYRRTIGPWRSTDIHSQPLEIERLSTRLTQLAGYRQTICSVRESAYLLRRINAEPEPIVAAATLARGRMTDAAAPLIANLHWADFELFVDLLFARAGWRRVSTLGGRMKDFDMLVEQPATGERACVQVKSATSQPVLNACYKAFQERQDADRCFFVCHTAAVALHAPEASPKPFHLWTGDRLAGLAVDQGLLSWLIDRAG